MTLILFAFAMILMLMISALISLHQQAELQNRKELRRQPIWTDVRPRS